MSFYSDADHRSDSGTQFNQNGPSFCKQFTLFLHSLSCHHQHSSLLREGKARITLFASESNAQTFDFYVRHSNSQCNPTDWNVHSPETSLTYPLRLVRFFHFFLEKNVHFTSNAGHYIENIGNSTLKLIEILKTGMVSILLFARHAPEGCLLLDIFQDISLSQWLALTPPELVKAHLGFSDEVIHHLNKVKQVIVR